MPAVPFEKRHGRMVYGVEGVSNGGHLGGSGLVDCFPGYWKSQTVSL